jgi:UDP-3-O-[3-hydroxymyristoyl] glucosamine N-acyltransferase
VRSGSDLGGAEVSAPALIGSGVELGEAVRLEGPVVIGDGCRLGPGALVKESVLLAEAELAPRAVIAGGIAAVAES